MQREKRRAYPGMKYIKSQGETRKSDGGFSSQANDNPKVTSTRIIKPNTVVTGGSDRVLVASTGFVAVPVLVREICRVHQESPKQPILLLSLSPRRRPYPERIRRRWSDCPGTRGRGRCETVPAACSPSPVAGRGGTTPSGQRLCRAFRQGVGRPNADHPGIARFPSTQSRRVAKEAEAINAR